MAFRADGNKSQVCNAMGDILNRIGDKWSVMVVGQLTRKTMRFNELRHTIGGISQRMLTLTLRNLERDGLVTRTVYPVVPPRVEYALTPLGASLHSTVQALVTWTESNQDTVAAARAAYDAREDQVMASVPPSGT